VEDSSEFVTLAGRRVPVVSVHDGEAGLLDNIGSLLGVRQEALAVRKFSKCGRPDQVYRYQHLDAESVIEACGKALAETALEEVVVSRRVLEEAQARQVANGGGTSDWRELWDVAPGAAEGTQPAGS
jgi:pyruvate dehydrogenase E1 component